MSLSLKISLTGFEVDISDFGAVIRDLVTVQLDQQARDAVKAMIGEVRKNFDMVVDVLSPLYAVNSQTAFQTDWPNIYEKFKNTYLKQWDVMRTHCHVVMDQLGRIKKAQDWKRHLPLLRNAVERLDDLGKKWISNDEELTRAMSNFLGEVNNGLTSVNDKILMADAVGAFQTLQEFLADTEPKVLAIKARLEELSRVSAKL